jgi:hypothetical protein
MRKQASQASVPNKPHPKQALAALTVAAHRDSRGSPAVMVTVSLVRRVQSRCPACQAPSGQIDTPGSHPKKSPNRRLVEARILPNRHRRPSRLDRNTSYADVFSEIPRLRFENGASSRLRPGRRRRNRRLRFPRQAMLPHRPGLLPAWLAGRRTAARGISGVLASTLPGAPSTKRNTRVRCRVCALPETRIRNAVMPLTAYSRSHP